MKSRVTFLVQVTRLSGSDPRFSVPASRQVWLYLISGRISRLCIVYIFLKMKVKPVCLNIAGALCQVCLRAIFSNIITMPTVSSKIKSMARCRSAVSSKNMFSLDPRSSSGRQ